MPPRESRTPIAKQHTTYPSPNPHGARFNKKDSAIYKVVLCFFNFPPSLLKGGILRESQNKKEKRKEKILGKMDE
jgi:hypothetical protein